MKKTLLRALKSLLDFLMFETMAFPRVKTYRER